MSKRSTSQIMVDKTERDLIVAFYRLSSSNCSTLSTLENDKMRIEKNEKTLIKSL